MIKAIQYCRLVFVLILFISNHALAQTSYVLPEGKKIVDLPDHYFAYINLSSSLVKGKFRWHEIPDSMDKYHPRLYKDSTKKVLIHRLNTNQMKLFFTSKAFAWPPHTDNLDDLVITSTLYLIAKQPKIGDLTPIIILIIAEDYNELIYVLMNKEDKPVATLSLGGEICFGPETTTDTFVTMCPYRVSMIKQNNISSYVLHISYIVHPADYEKTNFVHSLTIDSITYKTSVNTNGKIQTVRLDSTRYTRYANLRNEFH